MAVNRVRSISPRRDLERSRFGRSFKVIGVRISKGATTRRTAESQRVHMCDSTLNADDERAGGGGGGVFGGWGWVCFFLGGSWRGFSKVGAGPAGEGRRHDATMDLMSSAMWGLSLWGGCHVGDSHHVGGRLAPGEAGCSLAEEGAVRAGLHLGFNVTCAAVGVLLIEELAALSRALPGGDSLPRQIANAHVAFNVIGVAAFLPFTAKIARLLERSLPDKPAAAAQHHAA